LFADLPAHEVWIASATHVLGQDKAVNYYVDACKKLSLQIHWTWEGLETVDQLLALQKLATRRNANLILIATHTHVGRVKWICKWKGIQVKQFMVADGIARPQEARTDPILEFAFPIMRWLGVLDSFLAYAKRRRAKGVL
jgi:hypothetical protein